MSELLGIIFQWLIVGIVCYILFYVPNSVRMDSVIILIGQIPNRILFDLIETPDDV